MPMEWALFEIVKLLKPEKALIRGVVESSRLHRVIPSSIAQPHRATMPKLSASGKRDRGKRSWVPAPGCWPGARRPGRGRAKFAAMAEGARIASKRFW